jgi:ech hydrogenase subunit A
LVIVPLITALLLLVFRSNRARAVLVIAAVVLLVALSLVLTVRYLPASSGFAVAQSGIVSYVMLGVDLLCCLYVLYRGIRASNYLAIFLAALQGILALVYEFGFSHNAAVSTDVYVDALSLIMTLIIAVIGGAICVYALGYMQSYQEHLEHEGSRLAVSGEPSRVAEALRLIRDRRHVFFALMFVFLAAMFALVFSNRLSWLLTAWEVTTVCSFALIGYDRTEESIRNSFRAVVVNLSGGLAFTLALIMLAGGGTPIFELDKLIEAGVDGALVLPLMLLAFAGITKAAQMPFQGWLLGAMVAPTPVSALLHSSTMVKAGVFLLIKLAPTFGWNVPGLFVLIVGALSFLGCTALAISQSNAKRALAYSTVANLGLIVCCAGVGTPEASWAAIFLLIFHAAAKALLFCCVGTAEHHLGSRNIERLDNIFVRMPWLASCMALGMMAMFIAPFGMLVSKWAALVSLIESGHLELLFVLAFGSALTFVIWAKWLGKVLAIGREDERISTRVSRTETVSLAFMAFLLIALTLAIPYVSELFVMPYLWETGQILQLPLWSTASDVLGYDNLMIVSVVFMVMLALLAVQILRRRPPSNDTVYLAGVGADSEERSYYNAFGELSDATQRNWYLDELFGEKILVRPATILLSAVIAVFFIFGIILELMLV